MITSEDFSDTFDPSEGLVACFILSLAWIFGCGMLFGGVPATVGAEVAASIVAVTFGPVAIVMTAMVIAAGTFAVLKAVGK